MTDCRYCEKEMEVEEITDIYIRYDQDTVGTFSVYITFLCEKCKTMLLDEIHGDGKQKIEKCLMSLIDGHVQRGRKR